MFTKSNNENATRPHTPTTRGSTTLDGSISTRCPPEPRPRRRPSSAVTVQSDVDLLFLHNVDTATRRHGSSSPSRELAGGAGGSRAHPKARDAARAASAIAPPAERAPPRRPPPPPRPSPEALWRRLSLFTYYNDYFHAVHWPLI
ncbi:hypothetical protein EVAR_86964_1 [Eumeta japonica]|uniref:Uncharacterized protein n=1 Tax=Eumeta variegata TaxID=151549 RepID=A0A4C1W6M5_EUMVA|nr:hypothetical protein EVAR_86964_1 [Eumeta japonica]